MSIRRRLWALVFGRRVTAFLRSEVDHAGMMCTAIALRSAGLAARGDAVEARRVAARGNDWAGRLHVRREQLGRLVFFT